MSYDPSAIATWANAVTVARVLISPFLFVLIRGDKGSWAAFLLWFLLCSSDGVDGYLARRHGATRSGAFLDPLADKVLVLGAMFVLVNVGVFWIVPVVIIAVREVAISVYRVFAGASGVTVPAKKLAKVKTVTQQFAVAFALAPVTTRRATWTWQSLLWAAVILTLITGAQYFLASHRIAQAQAEHAM